MLTRYFVGERAKTQPSATQSAARIWALCMLGAFPYFIYTSVSKVNTYQEVKQQQKW